MASTTPPHPTEVHVTSGKTGFAQVIRAGEHVITADEPAALGGTDTGPDPYQLLLASLGACTSITVQMYAKRKGWPLRSISVRLRHRKVHAEDCATCDKNPGAYMDRIEKDITIEGPDLTDDQRSRLLQIADRCPVHRTLLGEIEIRSVSQSPGEESLSNPSEGKTES